MYAETTVPTHRYAAKGLSVLCFPTDQGWFAADD
jgi:hypothetical protein